MDLSKDFKEFFESINTIFLRRIHLLMPSNDSIRLQ